ncbi:transcription factor MYB98-like [Silene latifolia]|uniref:transcription factor MYB98-like n=1 Tax=Silene latifolia TaxID=37657 RepID=UPI003D770427
MPFSMDFDAKFGEKFPSQMPLFFHDQNYSPKQRDDHQFSLEGTLSSKSSNYLQDDLNQIEYFNLNNAPSSSSIPIFSLQSTCVFDTFENSTFSCMPNLDFFEHKPYENHVGNQGALVPYMDNNNFTRSGEVGVLGHSHMMVTPINMVSPIGLTHNPFSYRDFGLTKSFKLPDEGSSTSPKAGANLIRNSLSATMVKRRGRGHKKKINLVKGQWTIEEDRRLVQLVERYGIRKWSQIADMLTGRIGKQCRERWHNHLKPDIKKEVWSEEEDRILIKSHKEIGNKWAEIAKLLPGRTENSIKNHWNATKRRQLSKRKCKSKYPNQSSLLQDYIKSLTPEVINAGCRKKPKPTLQNNNTNTNTNTDTNTNTNSANDQIGSSDLGTGYPIEADQFDFSEVPDFDFDEQLFEESSIDSLLDCMSNEDDDNATTYEIMDDTSMDLNAMLQSEDHQEEVDLNQMVNQANL